MGYRATFYLVDVDPPSSHAYILRMLRAMGAVAHPSSSVELFEHEQKWTNRADAYAGIHRIFPGISFTVLSDWEDEEDCLAEAFWPGGSSSLKITDGDMLHRVALAVEEDPGS